MAKKPLYISGDTPSPFTISNWLTIVKTCERLSNNNYTVYLKEIRVRLASGAEELASPFVFVSGVAEYWNQGGRI